MVSMCATQAVLAWVEGLAVVLAVVVGTTKIERVLLLWLEGF